jgi:hypothetical protein
MLQRGEQLVHAQVEAEGGLVHEDILRPEAEVGWSSNCRKAACGFTGDPDALGFARAAAGEDDVPDRVLRHGSGTPR